MNETAPTPITYTGAPPKLGNQEQRILDALWSEAGMLMSKTRLTEKVWDSDKHIAAPGSNVLEVVIGRLRKKLAAAGANVTIDTVRLSGYRLAFNAPEAPQA